MNPADAIRHAIQSLLDTLDDGWTLTQHVVVMGLERVYDGQIESSSWYWAPPGQAEWMTSGLIMEAIEAREGSDTEY